MTTTPLRPPGHPPTNPPHGAGIGAAAAAGTAAAAGAADGVGAADGDRAAKLRAAALHAVHGLAHDPAGLAAVADAVLDLLAEQTVATDHDDDTPDRDGDAVVGLVDGAVLGDSVRWLARCEARVTAEKLRRVDAIARRETYRDDAERSPADWVATHLHLAPRDAHRQVRLAAALHRLPRVAATLAAGTITPAHAAAAARGLATLDDHATAAGIAAGDDLDAWQTIQTDHTAAVAELDTFTTEQLTPTADDNGGDGGGLPDPTVLGQRIAAWTITRHPASDRDRTSRALRHRGLRWLAHRDANGNHTAILTTTDDGRAQLDATLGPLATPTNADDDRSLAQRHHDALLAAAGHSAAAAASGPAPTRARVLLFDTHARRTGHPDAPPAWLSGVGPVGSDTAALIACDATTTDIVYDSDRGIWITSHGDGTPSARQRDIILARDRVCVGCAAPASRCQIHHIRYRADNGATIIANLVLVCWSCHHGLHHLGWRITHGPDGYRITKRRTG